MWKVVLNAIRDVVLGGIMLMAAVTALSTAIGLVIWVVYGFINYH